MTTRRLVNVVALLALCALLGPVGHSSSAPARSFFVGVDEDALKWGHAKSARAVAATLGVRAVRVTVIWHPGEERLSGDDRAVLDGAILGARSLRVVLAVYGDADDAPQDDVSRGQYCGYVADLLRVYPSVRDVVIWNEPNSPSFWQPQFDPDGSPAAPGAYEALLARCWSVLHTARRGVNVIAASAPRGNDDPRGAVAGSHSPGAWYRELGAAYRASGRGQPIFDTVGHNPYPDFSSERPWVRHTQSRSIAQGDHDKLTKALDGAFRGTGQPVPGEGRVRIWYLEQGFQTKIDRGKEDAYTGRENDRFALPAWTPQAGSRTGRAPDQATQLVDAIKLAYCQPNVGAYFNFLLADEPDLRGWQSGLLWADWTPKPSFSAVTDVIHDVNAGRVDCAALSAAPAIPPPTTELPLRVSEARVSDLTPFSATVSWQTSLPAETQLAYGLRESGPTLWRDAAGRRRHHSVTLTGLSFATSYRVWLSAVGPDGLQAATALDFHTRGLSGELRATVARKTGALLVDGEPFFPLMVWGQCPGSYAQSIAAGITLFAENPCGDLEKQLAALDGRALSAGVSGRPGASGPGLIGYFHPDEADALGLTGSTLPPPPDGGETGVSFLTLTNHFYSDLDPLPTGRDMYPDLIAAADVVGFDLYPLQEFCRPQRLSNVFDAQRELVQLARGKPTFQWIEAAGWRCPRGQTAVTPTTVRAEAWLAIAGGARGLGFFPSGWEPEIGSAIRRISRDLAKIGPALFAPAVGASAESGSPVLVGAHSDHGALYVVAVNASPDPAEATITLPGLRGRPLIVLDEGRGVSADGDTFVDRFPPRATHIYVVPPPGA